MEDLIIKSVDQILKNDFTQIEKKKILREINIDVNKTLITEKTITINKKTPDSFNLGSYVISKEKEAISTMVPINNEFANEYLSKAEKKLLDICKKEKMSNQETNILLMYYNQLKINIIEQTHSMKNITDYNIE